MPEKKNVQSKIFNQHSGVACITLYETSFVNDSRFKLQLSKIIVLIEVDFSQTEINVQPMKNVAETI